MICLKERNGKLILAITITICITVLACVCVVCYEGITIKHKMHQYTHNTGTIVNTYPDTEQDKDRADIPTSDNLVKAIQHIFDEGVDE